MPTSQPRVLTIVHTAVKLLKPMSVIDIGVGHGKTGVLVREYLDVMQERYSPRDWITKIYGIEPFAAYHNPLWDYAYDSVLVQDARVGLELLPDVDLVLALDVWEHFEPAYARQVLDLCMAKARHLLISTPVEPAQQGSVFGNDYEQHVSKWAPEDFRHIPHRLVMRTPQDWIILLSAREAMPRPLCRMADPYQQAKQSLKLAASIWLRRVSGRI